MVVGSAFSCMGSRRSQIATRLRLCLEIHRFYLDQGGMNFPIANAFELGELLLRRFDRQFSAGR